MCFEYVYNPRSCEAGFLHKKENMSELCVSQRARHGARSALNLAVWAV